jgi:glucokinase
MSSDDRRAIGIDVGGTKILGVVADPQGRLLHRLMAPTPKDPDLVAAAIGDALTALVADFDKNCDEPGSGLVGVGVGVPGLVDRHGVLRYGPNVPGVAGLDVAAELRPITDLPIVAENDASLAAVAEHRIGAARGHRHAVIITQGTGIGGGLIVEGALMRGAHGFAGEPGHMMVDPAGPICACGTQGCWEAMASGTGLANLARRLVTHGGAVKILELAGGNPGHIRGEHVAEALAADDQDAVQLLEEFARWVAVGLKGLVTVLDPSIVVLGGGLTALSDEFIGDVEAHLAKTLLGAPYRPMVSVVPTELGPDAGAVGGALLAMDPGEDR